MDDLIETTITLTTINEDVLICNSDSPLLTDLNSKSIINDSDSEEHINHVISTIDINDNEAIEDSVAKSNAINEIDIEEQHVDSLLQNKPAVAVNAATRPCQFSISRVKNIMKLDPELSLSSKESVFLVAKATEYFVDYISKEAYKYTLQASRKTIQKKDIEQAVANIDPLYFLEAALD